MTLAPTAPISQTAYAEPSTKNTQVVEQVIATPKSYTVVSGDYLDAIAQNNNTTWQVLFNKNTDIVDPNLIYVDQVINLPSAGESIPERVVNPTDGPVSHVEAPVTAPSPEVVQSTSPAPTSDYTAPVEVNSEPVIEQAPAPVVANTSGCGDNDAAHYIYMHESTCNTSAVNAGGCYGIGQDCNGIVSATCGPDYACQNEYFTNYVNGRYGGWDGAYSFWLANGWY